MIKVKIEDSRLERSCHVKQRNYFEKNCKNNKYEWLQLVTERQKYCQWDLVFEKYCGLTNYHMRTDLTQVIFSLYGEDFNVNAFENILNLEISQSKTIDRISSRLLSFVEFNEGWFNGEGSIFKKRKIQSLIDAFNNYFNFSLKIPKIFPKLDDKIICEWSFTNYEIELEIELDSLQAKFDVLDLIEDQNDKSFELDLSKEKNWRTINKELRLVIGVE